jgi:hypothetical protein
MAKPVFRKNCCQQQNHLHAGLGQLIEKKIEDKVGNSQRSDCDNAGQDVVLKAAQRTGKDGFQSFLLTMRILEAGRARQCSIRHRCFWDGVPITLGVVPSKRLGGSY